MGSDYYEKDSVLFEYLFFHYGKKNDYLPFSEGPHSALDFPARVVQRALEGVPRLASLRALDLGCAVGRSSFELSRFFEEVIAIDFSKTLIKAAIEIQQTREMVISAVEEVGRINRVSIALPVGVFPERVQFYQGDALNLSSTYGTFDLILASNLIDRLQYPQRFLKEIGSFLNPGGLFVLSSPYTWMESFTSKPEWLNPEKNNFDALKTILEPAYVLLKREDIPMLIREHRRKYQWTMCDLTVWIKK